VSLPGLPKSTTAKVDCGDCHACCQNQMVVLLPGDDATCGGWKLDGPHKVMRQRENGDCVHLGPSGCQIHGRHPLMCRAFDCVGAAQHPVLSRLPGASNDAVQKEGRRRLAAMKGGASGAAK
jgi:hypothetical protein